MVELHFTVNVFAECRFFVLVFEFLAFEKIKNAVSRSGRRLHIRQSLRYLRKGCGEQAHIQNERDDNAESERRVVDDEYRAENADRNVCYVAHNVHQGLHHSREELRLSVCVVNRLVQPFEHVFYLISRTGNANHFVTRIHLLDISVEFAEIFLVRREIFLRTRHYYNNREQSDKRYSERDKSQSPFRHKHHHKTTHKLRRRRNYHRQRVCQALLQSRNVVGNAAQNIAL